nr:MAG TPA: hypothetical protein [Caudoviricetes sp.]
MTLYDLTNVLSSSTKVMIYVRKQIGNMVVVLHTNDITNDDLSDLCVASKKLNEAEILMLRAKDDCVHVGIGEIVVNSNTRIL